MKDKLLDLGLLLALIIVAFLVGITLYGNSFNFKGFGGKNGIGQTKQISAPNPANAVSAESNSQAPADKQTNTATNPSVQVVNPNNPNGNSEAANTNNTSEIAVVAAPQTDAASSEQTPANSETGTPVVEVVAAPLPAGSFELQSIGFSYVTGGAGACGITLEAWKHVAVSRDILAKYPCGSEITINIDKPIAGHSSFKAIVGDTMNKKHTKTVNIYVGKNEPALEYGRQEGSLVP